MAKDTFNNLNQEKQDKIIRSLKKIFQEKPLQQVTVKEIVEDLDIARGSFYQYFQDLIDAYFTFLDKETVDIHKKFMEIFVSESRNLQTSLELYGQDLSQILFQEETYNIYKNKYVYWDEALN